MYVDDIKKSIILYEKTKKELIIILKEKNVPNKKIDMLKQIKYIAID